MYPKLPPLPAPETVESLADAREIQAVQRQLSLGLDSLRRALQCETFLQLSKNPRAISGTDFQELVSWFQWAESTSTPRAGGQTGMRPLSPAALQVSALAQARVQPAAYVLVQEPQSVPQGRQVVVEPGAGQLQLRVVE